MYLLSYKQIVRKEKKINEESNNSSSFSVSDSEEAVAAPTETSPLLSNSRKQPQC